MNAWVNFCRVSSFFEGDRWSREQEGQEWPQGETEPGTLEGQWGVEEALSRGGLRIGVAVSWMRQTIHLLGFEVCGRAGGVMEAVKLKWFDCESQGRRRRVGEGRWSFGGTSNLKP